MFASFFNCLKPIHTSLDDERYQALFGFIENYLTRFGSLPILLSHPYDFINYCAIQKQKREGFDPINLLEQIHSFVFSPKFNVHMYNSQLPKCYIPLLKNISNPYPLFAEHMKAILVIFKMPDEFSDQFMHQFESGVNENMNELCNLFEKIIAKRTFALHPE